MLDLQGTTFIDMGGVRILLAAAEHARAAAGTFEIVHLTAPVTRMLTLTGADRALERPTTAFPQRRERVTAREPATPLAGPHNGRPPLPSHSDLRSVNDGRALRRHARPIVL